MDLQFDSLIEKLRKEGIDQGKERAAQIVREAEDKARAILKAAETQAERIVAEAKKAADKFHANSELALRQAARDTQLLVKRRIHELFDRVFKREVAEALSPEFLKEMILRLVDHWGKGAEVEITLNPEDLKRLEAVLFTGLRKDLKASVTLLPNPGISAGFRIGLKGEDVYYDFTDESIAETLKQFLNPRLKEILDGGNG